MAIVLGKLFLYMLLGSFVADVFRRSAWGSWILFLFVPLCLTPLWLDIKESPFFWIKTYSCIFGLCWVLLIRYTSLGKRRWPFAIAYWILAINILEAVSSNAFSANLLQWYDSHSEFIIGWLFWVKIFGSSAALLLIFANRYCGLQWERHWLYGIYALLLVSLLCPLDGQFLSGYAGPIINAVAGLILVATFPPVSTLTVAKERNRDFLWDIPWAWIWGFTFWDWIFIYHVFPASAGRTISTLLGTILVTWLRGRKLWIQSRAYVLTFHLIFAFTFPSIIAQMDTPSWESATLGNIFAFVSLLWMSVYYYWYVKNEPLTKK